MGEVRERVKLENFVDRYLFEEGKINKDAIRNLEIQALVDTGSTRLVLPEDIVERLGLRKIGRVVVSYADERKEERDVCGAVMITIAERSTDSSCVVGPPLSEPLIGQVILEELDLIVDCNEQRLKPRPESPYLPLLKMKKVFEIWGYRLR
ncbi:MAG: aspartyl protease family protein [bacterium]